MTPYLLVMLLSSGEIVRSEVTFDYCLMYVQKLHQNETPVSEWTEGVCDDGAAILRDGEMVPITELLEHLNKTDRALAGIINHWREFSDMMIFNNAVNRDDYGMSERIEAAAKLVGR